MRYTPSVDEGERAYIDGLSCTSRTRAESAAEYRRMIAAVERAAAEKALTDAADALGSGWPDEIREWLRARAAALGLTAEQERDNDEG